MGGIVEAAVWQTLTTKTLYGKGGRGVDFRRYNVYLDKKAINALNVSNPKGLDPKTLSLDSIGKDELEFMEAIGRAYAENIDWKERDVLSWQTCGGQPKLKLPKSPVLPQAQASKGDDEDPYQEYVDFIEWEIEKRFGYRGSPSILNLQGLRSIRSFCNRAAQALAQPRKSATTLVSYFSAGKEAENILDAEQEAKEKEPGVIQVLLTRLLNFVVGIFSFDDNHHDSRGIIFLFVILVVIPGLLIHYTGDGLRYVIAWMLFLVLIGLLLHIPDALQTFWQAGVERFSTKKS